MNEIELLKTKLTKLEAENKYLKELLDNAGISYSDTPNQTENTIIPFDVTPEIASRFFSMFWGRTDVYAKRTVQKSTGKANYYPQCNNFWKDFCPRKHGAKIKCTECENQSYRKLEKEQIIAHLKGEKTDGSDVIGIYPLLPDDTCRFIVFDFDDHLDKETSSVLWKEEILALKQICDINGIDSLIERSRSGNGAHLWIFFSDRTDTALVRKFGNLLIKKGSEYVNLKSFDYYDRMLPMQDYLKQGSLGNQIGYSIYSHDANDKIANTNSIFNMENYYETYSKDLLSARNEIIISSPAISGKKVHKLKDLLKETQENGVKIRIITWKPNLYGYGDPVYWVELQEEMRSFGFNVELVENYCEHYCIVDHEIVWYGSMNFLGKEDAEDNLMRVCSKGIAAELLELTFGTDKYFGESLS